MTLSISKLGILLLVAGFLFPISNVYGHGLGIDTISSVDIQGKEISISVELPPSFDNFEEKQITITATEDETKENEKNDKERRKDITVAEIRSAGYGAGSDIDQNQQSD